MALDSAALYQGACIGGTPFPRGGVGGRPSCGPPGHSVLSSDTLEIEALGAEHLRVRVKCGLYPHRGQRLGETEATASCSLPFFIVFVVTCNSLLGPISLSSGMSYSLKTWGTEKGGHRY